MRFSKIMLGLVVLVWQHVLLAQDVNHLYAQKMTQFIDQFSGQFGYTKPDLVTLFGQVTPSEIILKKITRPTEQRLSWFKYKKLFLDKSRIENGADFYRRHEKVLLAAYEQYGVPPSIIVAILGVETRYGKVMGGDSVIQALSTIAFGYPKREAYFTKELKVFLQLAKREKFDPLSLKGSYAGAMGMAQFMPSSYLHFALDYDGDGKSDLWHTPADAIFSIAHYLQQNGWQRDRVIVDRAVMKRPYWGRQDHKPFTTFAKLNQQGVDTQNVVVAPETSVGFLSLVGERKKMHFITFKNFAVITTYNTSPLYAMAVFELAKAIESKL